MPKFRLSTEHVTTTYYVKDVEAKNKEEALEDACNNSEDWEQTDTQVDDGMGDNDIRVKEIK